MKLVYIGLIILASFALFSLAVAIPRQLRDITDRLDALIEVLKRNSERNQ
ncbi:MAG TPA: hypothetical protein VHS59_04600 [Bacillota bacterium]|nr:hypothetical protein [Bacillota bacterium]